MRNDEQDSTPGERSLEPEQDAPAETETGAGSDVETRQDSAVGRDSVEKSVTLAPNVGELLVEARAQLGLSISEISDRLHLTEHFVRAMETGEYGKLPGEVYVKGYLKSYALLLGLNVEQVMAAYLRSSAQVTYQNNSANSVPARFKRNWLVLLLIVVLAGTVAAAAWWAFSAFGIAAGIPVFAPGRRNGKEFQL